MKQKKIIKNSSKRLPNRSYHYVSFEQIHLNRTKLSFQNEQDLLYTEDLF